MTVQNTPSFVDYVGDDVTLVFNFTFRVDDVSWLTVDFTDDFDTFTVNLDQELNPGGTVEYLVAPPSPGMGGPDPSFRVTRVVPANQLLEYTRYDPFDSLSHENALDKLTMILQDQVTAIDVVAADATAGILANNLLITTGLSPGHQHVEADIIDLGNYTSSSVDEDIVGFWEFINVSGLAVYDAGKAAGGRISTQTGAMELLPLLANTHVRVNGPLAVSRAGVTADQLEISHTGLDVILTATNADELQMVGFTGRLTQGAETYAYVSDIAASGNLPPPSGANGLLVNDGVVWSEATSLFFDPATGALTWDMAIAPLAVAIVVNNVDPGGVIIQCGGSGSGSTNWAIFRSIDNGGVDYWELLDDHSLSSPNHILAFRHNDSGSPTTFIELDASGEIIIGSSAVGNGVYFTDLIGGGNMTMRIQDGVDYYIESRAAPGGDIANYGQLWVDDSDSGLYYKFNGVAAVRLDVAGGGIGGSIADNQVAVGNGVDAIDGSAALTFNGTTLDVDADIAMGDNFTLFFGNVAGDPNFTFNGTNLIGDGFAIGVDFVLTDAGQVRFSVDPAVRVWAHRARLRSSDAADTRFMEIWHNGVNAEIATTSGVILVSNSWNFQDNLLLNTVLDIFAIDNNDVAIVANAATLNAAISNSFDLDLAAATGNVTVTISGPGNPAGSYASIVARVQQDTVARTITWAGGTFRWAGGAQHVMNPTPSGFSIFTFETWDQGTTWEATGADYS
jgi:hypothetical protein